MTRRAARCLLVLALGTIAFPIAAGAAHATTPDPVIVISHSDGTYTVRHGETGTPATYTGGSAVVARDGTQVAYVTADGIYVAPVDGGAGIRVADATYTGPWWTPLGLLAGKKNGNVVVRLDPSGMTAPVDITASSRAGFSVLSPDGDFVARADADGIVVTDLQGRNPLRLLSGLRDAVESVVPTAWSPDGQLVSDVESPECGTGIVHGSFLRATAAAPHLASFDNLDVAAFEPGGRVIGYDATGTGPHCTNEVTTGISAMDVDGSHLTHLLTFSGGKSAGVTSGGPGPYAGDTTAPGPVTGVTATARPSSIDLAYTLPSDSDAAGVEIRYAIGTTAPASPTDGIDAGRALGSSIVLDRLPPDTTYSFAVFSEDWAGNTGAVATATATTPHQVRYDTTPIAPRSFFLWGSHAGFGTTVRNHSTGAPVAGVPVTLTVGDPAHPLLARHLVTDAHGIARSRFVVRSHSAPIALTLVATADHTGTVLTSRMDVAPRVLLSAPSSVRPGQHVIGRVTVTPGWPAYVWVGTNEHRWHRVALRRGPSATVTVDFGTITKPVSHVTAYIDSVREVIAARTVRLTS